MQGLIFPAVLLLLIALWGVWSSQNKYWRELKLRGISWEKTQAALRRGEGMLVVDLVTGPPRGLGHPSIWWLPESATEDQDLAPLLQPGGSARLVKCPRQLKNFQALQNLFPGKVLSQGWDAGIHANSPK